MGWDARLGGADRVRGRQIAAKGLDGREAACELVRRRACGFSGLGFVLRMETLRGNHAEAGVTQVRNHPSPHTHWPRNRLQF